MKRKIAKRGILLLAGVMAVTLLAGCKLADPTAGQKSSDQMIGIYVFEGEPLKKPVFGEMREDKTFEFPGVDGYGMYAMEYEDGIYQASDSAVEPGPLYLAEQTEQRGTVYVKDSHYYVITGVYRTADGKVYIKNEPETVPMGGNEYGVGRTIKGAYSYMSAEGDMIEWDIKLTLMLKTGGCPEKIVVKEFDDKDRLVKATSFKTSEIPEELEKQENTSYIITEYHTEGKIERKLCEEDTIPYRAFEGGGFAIQKNLKII